MNIPHQSFTTWKAFVTALQLFAILTTMLRLSFRYRRHTLWMDDFMVIPPLIMDLIAAVVMWFLYVEPENISTIQNKVALYWLASLSWLTILWFTRISLVLSMTRIFPVWGTIRRNCRGVSVAFGIFYVGFMCWLCTSACVPSANETPASHANILDCSNERHILVIAGFAADIFSCTFLVVYPIFILWLLPLPRGQYKLVMSLLCSCVFVFLSAAFYCAFFYGPSINGPGQPFVTGMLSQIEAGVSLLACNVLAFVTYLCRNDSWPDAIDDKIEWKKPKPPNAERTKVAASSGSLPMKIVHSQDRQSNGECSQWYSHESFSKAGVRFSEPRFS